MKKMQHAVGVGLSLAASAAGLGAQAAEPQAVFQQPPLPYAESALAPYISAETLQYHYGKHHKGYIDTLNKLVAGKPEAAMPLEKVVMSAEGKVFNAAAQAWNHDFYWHCLKKDGGGRPTGALAEAIARDFGSYEKLRGALADAATTLFGSGWAWLVVEDGKLKVVQTANADSPMKHGQKALLTIDVWEHAYYIDYRNARAKYVDAVLDHLADWDFAAANLAAAGRPR